jgi:hypothetical protein
MNFPTRKSPKIVFLVGKGSPEKRRGNESTPWLAAAVDSMAPIEAGFCLLQVFHEE